MAPPMNGKPLRVIHRGSVILSIMTDDPMKTIQFITIKRQEPVRSNSCGGVNGDICSDVVVMANRHPITTKAMAMYSSLVGRSNKIICVTHKLIIIERDPKTPMTAVGSHASANKSSMEAAADNTIATINNGRTNTDVLSGVGL